MFHYFEHWFDLDLGSAGLMSMLRNLGNVNALSYFPLILTFKAKLVDQYFSTGNVFSRTEDMLKREDLEQF